MRGDDDDRRIGIDLHDPAERFEPLAAVGPGALEVEVEQDRIRALALEQRQQVGGRAQRLDPLEHVAKRKPRRQRDVGVVVDDDREVEHVRHATSVAQLSGNEQWAFDKICVTIWHAACTVKGMKLAWRGAAQGGRIGDRGNSPSVSGQKLFGGGQ